MRDSKLRFNHATLVGCCAVLMWSVTIGLFRSVAEIFWPVAGAAMIFSVAGLCAHVAIDAPRLNIYPRLYLWVGGGLFVLYEGLLVVSIGYVADREQALALGMINYLWPSLTILLAVMLGQQRGHWTLIPAMLVCWLGISLVMKGEGSWSAYHVWQNIQRNPLGAAMAFLAAITWAVYSVFTRHCGKGVNGVPLFMLATASVLWLVYCCTSQALLVWSTAGLVQVTVMGMLMTLAYSSWNYAIQHGNLVVLATISYFIPVLSVLVASVWLNIQAGMSFCYGVALVTLGSLLSGFASSRSFKTR